MSAGATAAASQAPLAPQGGAPNEALLQALAAWRGRLAGVGVACRHVAFHAADPAWCLDLPAGEAALQARWLTLREEIDAAHPVAMARMDAAQGTDLLLAAAVPRNDGQAGVVGVVLAPPFNDRTVQLVWLSLAWLQVALQAGDQVRRLRAVQLVDLLGHVASQGGARMAAQEWVNRTAVLVRGQFPAEAATDVGLMLFQVVRQQPRWWVTAEAAWSEAGAPAVQAATELATEAVATMQECRQDEGWAMPILDRGRVVSVLVGQWRAEGGMPVWPEPALLTLRASVSLAEPLLRQWMRAERGLLPHALAVTRAGWRRFTGHGHLTWKAGAALALLVLAVLTAWPVADRVTASTVIEGRVRQVVTAPFDGFIGEVLVRPGERVHTGQVLARLDDRDLQLDQATQRSARDQAAGKLRQALAERDASAAAQAQAELQQTEAKLALAQTRLARTTLVAPMDGLIVKGDWMQQIGSPVESGKELFELANTEGYRVVLHVPDQDIARVQVGQEGRVRLAGHPQSAYPFRISRVTATASVEDGVNGFRVEANWVGQVPTLSPGMQGIGKVDVGDSHLLTIWTRSSLNWLRLKLWTWLW